MHLYPISLLNSLPTDDNKGRSDSLPLVLKTQQTIEISTMSSVCFIPCSNYVTRKNNTHSNTVWEFSQMRLFPCDRSYVLMRYFQTLTIGRYFLCQILNSVSNDNDGKWVDTATSSGLIRGLFIHCSLATILFVGCAFVYVCDEHIHPHSLLNPIRTLPCISFF